MKNLPAGKKLKNQQLIGNRLFVFELKNGAKSLILTPFKK